jgi:hypothetical protein
LSYNPRDEAIKRSKETIKWSNQMNDLAAEFNCEFDGWGALVENKDSVDEKTLLLTIAAVP